MFCSVPTKSNAFFTQYEDRHEHKFKHILAVKINLIIKLKHSFESCNERITFPCNFKISFANKQWVEQKN